MMGISLVWALRLIILFPGKASIVISCCSPSITNSQSTLESKG